MTDYFLDPHPQKRPNAIRHVNVSMKRRPGGVLDLFYVIEGLTDRLAIPAVEKPYRTDGLWRMTCLELFIRTEGQAYLEFNFSPSTQWAAYRFDSYRKGMLDLELDEPPNIKTLDEEYALFVSASVLLPSASVLDAGLSAVIEERDGTKSYWALAHPSAEPDFHNADCFIARLPAPDAP